MSEYDIDYYWDGEKFQKITKDNKEELIERIDRENEHWDFIKDLIDKLGAKDIDELEY